MSTNTPTLINLPPPPSDPLTPSDMGPGTPNSGTTTMSELSTVAIKDGHRGHLPHHQLPLEAERADRISRLAGLERVATARQGGLSHSTGGYHASTYGSMGAGLHQGTYGGQGSTGQPGMQAGGAGAQPAGYFDGSNNPAIMRERSTVGSASATGSVGGRTTWASGSDTGYEPSDHPDKMSEDQEEHERDEMMDAASSVGGDGFSDEGQSLVGFGEGARTPARQQSVLGSPVATTAKPTTAVPQYLRDPQQQQLPHPPSASFSAGTGISGSSAAATPPSVDAQRQEARLIDGMSYDQDVVDTAAADMAARRNQTTAETTERVMRERAAATKRSGASEDDAMRD